MTPYATPEEQKAYRRRWYRDRYRDKDFKEKESARKSEWFSKSEERQKKNFEYSRANKVKSEKVECGFTKDEMKAIRKKIGSKQVRTWLREIALREIQD